VSTQPTRRRTRKVTAPARLSMDEIIEHSHTVIAETEAEIRADYRQALNELIAEYNPLIKARRERDGREDELVDDE